MSIVTGRYLELSEGTFVRNVIGSSGDIPYEKIGNEYKHCKYGNNSWIDVWRRKVPSDNNDMICCVCESLDNILGAHIVLGEEAQEHAESTRIESKESNRVFIIPLCNDCNQQRDKLEISKKTYALHIFYYNLNIEHSIYCQVCRSKLRPSDKTIFKGIDKWDEYLLKTNINSTPSQPSYNRGARQHDLAGAKRRRYSNRKARSFR